MSKVRICDICGEPLTFKHYKVKRIYDSLWNADKSKLDICSTCWFIMKDYIKDNMNRKEKIYDKNN